MTKYKEHDGPAYIKVSVKTNRYLPAGTIVLSDDVAEKLENPTNILKIQKQEKPTK